MTAQQAQIADAIKQHKPHFPLLDGLRGVAAIAVVIFHFLEMVIWPYDKLWIGHGWLAVDFFFCLSGFVMGYAYDDRIQRMGLAEFFKGRLIRLHPMVVMGSVLGIVAFYANPFGITPGLTPGRMALIFLMSVLVIPFGVMKERGFNNFSLNAPSWSLFWEYIANIVFGIFLNRIPRWALIVLTVVGAVWLCWAGYHAGNLYGGWNTGSFWDGGARVTFSFSAGLLIYRMKWLLRSPLGFVSLSALLMLILVSPFKTGAWMREAAIIIFLLPLLVALGAGAKVGPRVTRLCGFLGDLSYPLYMVHYTVIWIWGDYAAKHKITGNGLYLPVTLGVTTMIGFATLVMQIYDKPVRRWLRLKL